MADDELLLLVIGEATLPCYPRKASALPAQASDGSTQGDCIPCYSHMLVY